jgi:hypothetical protein
MAENRHRLMVVFRHAIKRSFVSVPSLPPWQLPAACDVAHDRMTELIDSHPF